MISGGTAIAAWDNYDTLATAAGSAGSDKTKVVSQGQVDDARIGAIIAAAALFLDMAAPLLKEFQAAAKGAAILEAATERSAATALTKAAAAGPAAFEGAAGKELIERSVVELGVDETVQKSGKTVQQLIEIVGKDSKSAVLERLEAAAARGTAEGTTEAGGKVATAVATKGGTPAEQAFLASGALPELVQELPGAVRAGTLTAADCREARSPRRSTGSGRREVAKRGGWRDLSQALGADSAAGRRLMEWRNAIFDDLEHVREERAQGRGAAHRHRQELHERHRHVVHGCDRHGDQGCSQQVPGRAARHRQLRAHDDGRASSPTRAACTSTTCCPAALREKVAATTASHQEGLIWNRRLYDATAREPNTQLAETLRRQMRELGVTEFAYRPLSSPPTSPASPSGIDSLHAELDKAVQAGDTAAQAVSSSSRSAMRRR